MKTQIPVTKFAPFPVHHFAAALVLLLFGLPQTAAADVVTEWNQYTRDAIAASAITGNSIASARVFAIVHASMYDALNGVEGRFTPYHVDAVAPAGASRRAAVIQAAYSALAGLFPSQIPSLDVKLAASLAAITDDGNYQDSVSIARGRDWGALVAADILAWRSSDGFNTSPPPFTGGLLPGQWRPTPPGFAPMNCAQCATMVPFAIASPSQFRPVGPPALESAAYATDLNEVKALGRATGSTRTAEQTAIARFWAGNSAVHWNRIAVTLAVQNQNTLSENARLFALMNIALADAGIAGWDAKKHYVFWRPFHSIRLADTDGNPLTEPDPAWTPLLSTPAHPEYVSAATVFSAAAAGVLAAYFGDATTLTHESVGQPGVFRTHTSFSAALDENSEARIYAGLHYRSSCKDGSDMGAAVAGSVLSNVALPNNGQQLGQLSHDHPAGANASVEAAGAP